MLLSKLTVLPDATLFVWTSEKGRIFFSVGTGVCNDRLRAYDP